MATKKLHIFRRIGQLTFVALLAAAVLLAYSFVRSNIAVDFYKEQLREQLRQHEALRKSFNEVVRKNVITELVVNEDDSVCVVFVDGNNQEKVVPTNFKKGAVVYVDFMVNDGKLYLRRLFDQTTAPADGLVIDPNLQVVTKDISERPEEGAAPYAKLNQRGRWVVNATQGGALQLKKADDKAPRKPLVRDLPVRDYQEIEKEINTKVEDLGPGDVIQSLFGGKSKE